MGGVMKDLNKSFSTKFIIKKCYICGEISETAREPEKCGCCGKSFLPLNYFAKVHNHSEVEFKYLFSDTSEIEEEDLIKGLYVIW